MSNDLRLLDNASQRLLQNTEIIDVSQDPLGIQASLVSSSPNDVTWWVKKLHNNCLAVVGVCQSQSEGGFFDATVSLSALLWKKSSAKVRDLVNHVDLGPVSHNLTLTLAPQSCRMVLFCSFHLHI